MEIKIDLNSLNFKIKNNLKIKRKKILFNNHKILIFGNFYEKINNFNLFKNLNKISSRNGEFFFIYVNKKNNKILFGNSSTSYYQIFFKKDNKYLYLTLDIFKLIDSNSSLNLEKISEWLYLNGRNLNKQSFINNISILHPGTSLFIYNQQIKIKEVKPFSYKKKKNKENIYLNFLKVLKDSINLRVKKTNTKIIFGLSGGYDSRIILSLIDKEIKKKIIAITTGDNLSLEKIVAKKVSKTLNVSHKNILITRNKYYKDISKILEYGNYSNIFKNGIKEEIYKKLFSDYKSRYFLQGNALDVLISSSFSSKDLYKIRKKNNFIKWYIKRNMLFDSSEISKIFKKKSLNYKKQIKNNLLTRIKKIDNKTNFIDLNDALTFDIRIKRWHNPSLSVYIPITNMLIPTYDKSFLDFCSTIPTHLRIGDHFRKNILKIINLDVAKIPRPEDLIKIPKFKKFHTFDSDIGNDLKTNRKFSVILKNIFSNKNLISTNLIDFKFLRKLIFYEINSQNGNKRKVFMIITLLLFLIKFVKLKKNNI